MLFMPPRVALLTAIAAVTSAAAAVVLVVVVIVIVVVVMTISAQFMLMKGTKYLRSNLIATLLLVNL